VALLFCAKALPFQERPFGNTELDDCASSPFGLTVGLQESSLNREIGEVQAAIEEVLLRLGEIQKLFRAAGGSILAKPQPL
jgi:hypothetical protein